LTLVIRKTRRPVKVGVKFPRNYFPAHLSLHKRPPDTAIVQTPVKRFSFTSDAVLGKLLAGSGRESAPPNALITGVLFFLSIVPHGGQKRPQELDPGKLVPRSNSGPSGLDACMCVRLPTCRSSPDEVGPAGRCLFFVLSNFAGRVFRGLTFN
jgi:hypothetical protein